MAESIGGRCSCSEKKISSDLRALFTALRADNLATRAALAVIAAKLDADAGVTDVNYAALGLPAAMQTTL